MKLRLILFLVMFSLVAGPASAQSKLVRLSYSAGWEALPALVAIERGFFAEQNLIISAMRAPNATTALESLMASSSDFALLPQRQLLVYAAAPKADFGVIANGGWGAQMEIIVPATDTKTKSLTDLKGKKIGVVENAETLPVLVRLLNRFKLRMTDVNIRSLPPNSLNRAFRDRTVDAVMAVRHFSTALMVADKGRVIMKNDEIAKAIGRIHATPVMVNGRVLEKEKDTVQRFANAWIKAMVYLQQKPDDAATILRIYFHRQGITLSEATAKSWVGLAKYNRYNWGKADIADADYNGWALKTAGVLKVQPKVDKFIHNEFIDKAFKNLQAQAQAAEKKK